MSESGCSWVEDWLEASVCFRRMVVSVRQVRMSPEGSELWVREKKRQYDEMV